MKDQCLFVGCHGAKTDRFGFFECLYCSVERFGIFHGCSVVIVKCIASCRTECRELIVVAYTVDRFTSVFDPCGLHLIVELASAAAMWAGGWHLCQLPCIGDILEVGIDQCTDRTDRRCFSECGVVLFRFDIDDLRRVSAKLDLKCLISGNLCRDPHTLFTHDTERCVITDMPPVFDRSELLTCRKCLIVHLKLQRLVLQIALTALVTDTALKRVVDIVELHNILTLQEEPLIVCRDDCTVDRFLLT